MWTDRLKAGSKVWIADTWRGKPPVEVTVTRIAKLNTRNPRDKHIHFEPEAFGNTFFGWNGTCQSRYHHAYKTKAEAERNTG
jgi:hypothetical protein